MSTDFELRHERLLSTVTRLAELLREVGDQHWADSLDRSRTLIEQGKRAGLVSLVGSFGGAGSLNDVVISTRNGHRTGTIDVELANAELDRLRSQAWADAAALERELDRSG